MNAVTQDIVTPQPRTMPASKPFQWLVRRELWENRALYLVPAIVCGVIVLAVLLGIARVGSVQVDGQELEEGLRLLTEGDPVVRRVVVAVGFGILAWLVSVSTAFVVWFYTLDSLHSERRDRSILFWKSLPVSDTETVLSKLFMASLGIGAIAFGFVFATHLLLSIVYTVYLLAHGVGAGVVWSRMALLEAPAAYIYVLLVQALWFAPVYGYLLLVSAWAKRMTFLWAVLPPALIALVERISFGTHHFLDMIAHRLALMTQSGAFRFDPTMLQRGGPEKMEFPANLFELMNPIGLFSNPYFWAGLVVAAGFVVGAIWLRRYREPL
jgi:ABC-2 type transport system permease protein